MKLSMALTSQLRATARLSGNDAASAIPALRISKYNRGRAVDPQAIDGLGQAHGGLAQQVLEELGEDLSIGFRSGE
jgi:hypothetical protein